MGPLEMLFYNILIPSVCLALLFLLYIYLTQARRARGPRPGREHRVNIIRWVMVLAIIVGVMYFLVILEREGIIPF